MRDRRRIELEYISLEDETIEDKSASVQRPLRVKGSGQRRHPVRPAGRRLTVILTLLTALAVVSGGFAWFVLKDRKYAMSDEKEVMAPYYLYLLDETSKESLELAVGNIHPGETKQAVICVSNNDPEGAAPGFAIGRDTSFEYNMELAYTENMPIAYQIYSLQMVTDEIEIANGSYTVKVDQGGGHVIYMKEASITDNIAAAMQVSANSTAITDQNRIEMYGTNQSDALVNSDVMSANLGQYQMYDKDEHNNSLNLTAAVDASGNVTYDNDYYLITFTWEGDSAKFADYTKEMDLVYLVCQAKQPKPQQN